jgi:hypothetical protein
MLPPNDERPVSSTLKTPNPILDAITVRRITTHRSHGYMLMTMEFITHHPRFVGESFEPKGHL